MSFAPPGSTSIRPFRMVATTDHKASTQSLLLHPYKSSNSQLASYLDNYQPERYRDMAPAKPSMPAAKRSTTAKKATKSGAITKKIKGGGQTGGRVSTGPGTTVVTTRGASRRAACGAVLLTTELLEDILRHLDPRHLLIAQRVCRKFKAVISESNLLQQKLFLAPAEAASGWLCEGPTDRGEYVSSGNRTVRWTKISMDALKNCQQSGQTTYTIGEANHLLFEQLYMDRVLSDEVPAYVYSEVTLKRPGPTEDYPPLMRHLQASWRPMYLTQPPTEYVQLYYQGKEGPDIRRKGGVKVADVIKEGLALAQLYDEEIDWPEFKIVVEDMIVGDRVTRSRVRHWDR